MTSARFFAYALMTLLAASVLAMSFSARSAYAVDNLWFPGEGVKQDMYVKYRLQEESTNDNRPFEMTIYFKEQVDGNWMAPAFVVDQGRVINGTLKLAANLQALSGGGGVPPQMSTYISAYHGSIHYLDAFTTKNEPLSLTAGSWGKSASIGASEVKPLGTEKVSFAGAEDVCQADSCDATLIQWHKGVDSKVWIVNEFPYPVKALTYADVTTGNAPIQFALELLDTGTGQPEVPGSVTDIPKPPQGPFLTSRGTYEIELDWDPAEIRPEGAVVFGVTMTDSTGFPLERVNYDVTIKDSGGNMIQEFKNQNAELGLATHEVTFDTSGPMTVTVTLNSISGAPAGGGTFTEAVDFGIVVVPEFPVSAAIIAAVIIGMVALMTRAKSAGFGGLFGNRNAL
ncbi:MAG TPA: hypothetical protein VIE86_06185 [Nitrososphaera sp.]